MAGVPNNMQRFQIGRYNVVDNMELQKKNLDERAFYSMYPLHTNITELEPIMQKAYNNGLPSISNANSLMGIFEKDLKIINTYADYVRWKVFFKSQDLRVGITTPPEAINGCIGVNGSIFEMGLDSDVFGPNDVIIIEGFSSLPLIVRSESLPRGSEYIYEFALEDPSQHIEEGWFKYGMLVKAQIGSLIGEGQIERGNVHWTTGTSYIEMQVPMTTNGWEMKVTNKAWLAAQHAQIKVCDHKLKEMLGGEYVRINSFDSKFMEETNKQIDLGHAFGRMSGKFASPHLDRITGNPLPSGPGWYQYMESATYLEYNIHQNIIKFIQKYAPVTHNDKVKPNERDLHVYTGSAGLLKLQDDGAEIDRGQGVIQTAEYNYGHDKSFIAGDGRKVVTLGAKQYRSFYLEPFGKVTFHYLPFLDNTTIDSRKYNGYPYSSYEYIIFNDGRGDAREDNVYIARNPEMTGMYYSVGTWTPTGHISKNNNSNKGYHMGLGNELAYKIVRDESSTLIMKDPSLLTWIRPNLG